MNNKEASELTRLLAAATTAHDQFSNEHQDIIVTIGKGMFWSREFDMEARALAKKINDEFECFSNMRN